MAGAPQERILVIEDDATMARMLRALLEQARYAVRVERSGLTGLSGAALDRAM